MEGPYMDTDLGSDNKNIKWKGKIEKRVPRLVDFAGDFVRFGVDPARRH